MSWVSAAFLATSTLEAFGTLSQSNAMSVASDYNAKIHERDAQLAEEAAAFDAARIRVNNRLSLGAGRANVGAGGIQMSGSALEALAFSATQGEMNALAREYGGAVEAAGARSRASMSRFEGAAARRSGYTTAIAQGGSNLVTGYQIGLFT